MNQYLNFRWVFIKSSFLVFLLVFFVQCQREEPVIEANQYVSDQLNEDLKLIKESLNLSDFEMSWLEKPENKEFSKDLKFTLTQIFILFYLPKFP